MTGMPERPRIQVSSQYLRAGAGGGIGRCARLTLKALEGEARLRALAVEDDAFEAPDGVRGRGFGGGRAAFVAANTLGGLVSDWTLYDFAGTARAHAPLNLVGKPFALWAHGLEVWPGLLRGDYARAIRAASAVFVNSRHTLARLSESLPGLSTVHLCPLGTEMDFGGAPPPREPREPMVLFVGRNDETVSEEGGEVFAKGQDALIALWPSVVAQAPDAVLCFVGGGPKLERLRRLAAASPAAGSIKVLGSIPDAEVARLYRRARLFAMPSRLEGFGLVFAEAMSHGTPVLASTDDASPEVNAEGETGFCVSRRDPALATQRILSVLSDDVLFERLSRAAYERWARLYCFSAFRERFLGAASSAGLLGKTSPAPRPIARQVEAI
ncbi:MAG: glycosyltransferase [Caulobacteraceae bacterium]